MCTADALLKRLEIGAKIKRTKNYACTAFNTHTCFGITVLLQEHETHPPSEHLNPALAAGEEVATAAPRDAAASFAG